MVVSVTPHDEGLSESLTSYNTELEGNAAQINGHSAWDSACRNINTYQATTTSDVLTNTLFSSIPPQRLTRLVDLQQCHPTYQDRTGTRRLRWQLHTSSCPRRSLCAPQLRVYDVTVQFLSCRLPPPRLRRIAQPYIAMTIALIHDFGIHATRDRDPETGALLDVHKVPAWGVHRPRIERLHDCVGRVERDVPTRRRALCQEGPRADGMHHRTNRDRDDRHGSTGQHIWMSSLHSWMKAYSHRDPSTHLNLPFYMAGTSGRKITEEALIIPVGCQLCLA
ncbi:hypothetical protein V8E55_008179 [Tylopilus felleus]